MSLPNTTSMAGRYQPSYFLASLGNGGLAVSFFLYLMFMTPHKGSAIPTFDSLLAYSASAGALVSGLILLALAAVAYFAVQHFRLLVWNIGQYQAFKQTSAYNALVSGPGAVGLMVLPLTFAMSINVSFILGALFVPGLWSVAEYLFPGALVAFGVVAFFGLKIFNDYLSRIIVKGGADWSGNNSLAPMIAVFAFAMIGVGFAAPAAMSHTPVTALIGMIGSIFFLSAALLFGLVKLVMGFRDMMEHGVAVEASPSLWIMIPILTVSGIALVRMDHGLAHTFGAGDAPMARLVMITVLLSLQLVFGLLGYKVMKTLNYFDDYIHGAKSHPMSYALICPGVALFVFGMFFVHSGLVKAQLLSAADPVYWVMLAVLAGLQALTVRTLLKLNHKHLNDAAHHAKAIPAE